jgi:choline-glycine betaine transporter
VSRGRDDDQAWRRPSVATTERGDDRDWFVSPHNTSMVVARYVRSMATDDASAVERALGRLFAPVAVAAGAVVLAGFFFPTLVGDAVSGVGWVAVSLVFFVAALGYLAVLPHRGDSEGTAAAEYLLRVRRTGLSNVVRAVFRGQDPAVLGPPVAVFGCFFLVQTLRPAATSRVVATVADTLLWTGRPVFLAAVAFAVVFCLVATLGPWGEIRLGGADATPAYTYPTYFTLVFTAGIAAGIVFWGPAEALFHYGSPPPFFGAASESSAAIGDALVYSLFHWGVSAWSAYALVGVPVAYFVFNRGAPLRVSTVLAPLLGVDGLDSRWATLVDTLAVFATIGGIATSVALVSEQFLAGVAYQWDVPVGGVAPLVFVGGLTALFVLSSATGIHRGIRRIAAVAVVLFVGFGLVVALVGPTAFLLDRGTSALGRYAVALVPLSAYLGGQWVVDWTVWNWSWWFSWAPFAGLFVAALSRGRRVRTVVVTTVGATALATMVWFLLLGGTALFVQHTGRADVLGAVAAAGGSEAVAGFPVLDALPLGRVLLFVFLALIVVFTVSSADTSTLVVAILGTHRGEVPTTGGIVFWGTVQGVVAAAVLVAGGAETLQALAVLAGGPFAVLGVVAGVGLLTVWYRRERGHVSVVTRVRRRLPAIQQHHDVEPPEDD